MRPTNSLFQAAIKATTLLTGIQKHPSPVSTLRKLYSETLTTLSQLPESSIYRQSTTSITKSRLALLGSSDSKPLDDASEIVEKVSKQLGEEIELTILQAERELELAKKIGQWKSWEPLEVPAPENQWDYVMKE